MQVDSPTELRAGVATADITPPPGVDLTGGAFGPARGVLHPLQAKSLCLQSGDARVLLIACDLLGVEEAWADDTRRLISQKLAAPLDAVMIACTHTHGAPATIFLRNWGRKDEAYLASLRDKLVDVASRAVAGLCRAEISAGTVACPGVGVNRSLAGGPVDDALGILRVSDASGAPLAVIVNYACHPVNLHSSGMITPDFPFYLEEPIRKALGSDAPVLFLSGAGGDINPANFRAQTPSETAARATAGKLAECTLRVLPTLSPMHAPAIVHHAMEVALPLAALPSRSALLAGIADAQEKLAAVSDTSPTNWEYCKHKTALEWARDALVAVESGAPATSRKVELSAWRIGDARIVAVPGELFCEFGIALRRNGPLPHLMIATQANGTIGYLPSRAAFEKRTYEAAHCPRYLGTYFYAPEVGDVVLEAITKLVRLISR